MIYLSFCITTISVKPLMWDSSLGMTSRNGSKHFRKIGRGICSPEKVLQKENIGDHICLHMQLSAKDGNLISLHIKGSEYDPRTATVKSYHAGAQNYRGCIYVIQVVSSKPHF